MEAYSHQKRSKGLLYVGMVILFALLLSACGSNTTTSGGGSTPTPGPDLITAGTLTVGSDTTYPPAGVYRYNNESGDRF